MDALAQLTTALRGRYEILREIGAGGMATVYLARDVRHERNVALKVLKPELGAVLGVERFLSEIKVTANLQHPNLLPLFDSGEAGGQLFYVMPFVEGESLRARLEREKQLPVDEAVRMSVAIAGALDYAHKQGVIHRDLKPENILLQHGQPVVADFGIALAVSKAGGNRITQTGLSLGTPQYMSPEQATGDRVIDGRSDIYSLGAMTYEMLTGEPPHTGNTAQAIIARILTEKPRSIRSTRGAVPEYVEAAVEHALEKLPADRFATAHEFAESLQGRLSVVPRAGMAERTAALARGWRSRLRDPVVLALSALTIASMLAAVSFARRQPATAPTRAVRFVISTPDSAPPIGTPPWPAAISPDGGTVVYSSQQGAGGTMLYSLRTDQLEGHLIPGTTNGFQPLFSPDGQWLAFEADGKEKKVRLDGSAPVTIADGGAYNGSDWTTNDEIVVGATGKFHGLARVSAAGGELVQFTRPDSSKNERDHLWPIVLADGKTVVFTLWSGSLASARLAITSLGDGKVTPLEVKAIRPLAVLEGALIYVQADGAVMAVPFDPGAKRTIGKPVPVLDPVTVGTTQNGNSGIFISRGGALVTSRGGSRSQLVWVERSGAAHPVLSEARSFVSPRLSPDGRRIAVIIKEIQKSAVWIYDIATSTLSRLTSVETAWSPEWTRDGKRIVFIVAGDKTRTAVWSQLAEGGSPAEKLVDLADHTVSAVISPDARSLLVSLYHDNNWNVLRVPLDSTRTARGFLASKVDELAPRFSPDGRWVAVSSDESGHDEVYVNSFPDPSARVQASVGGGTEPVWSADGNRLYYRSGGALMAAKWAASPTFRVLARDTVLARINGWLPAELFVAQYDVTRDGARILALMTNRDDFQLVAVPNWLAEFRQRREESRAK